MRRHLQEQLPEYMVPAVYVAIERMPLTPNGKLDRRALPAPSGERPGQERGYVGARTVTEELLAGIWSRVLGLERVGVEDDFFGLGGDSILCLKIVARAREAGLQISVQQIFPYQTIALLDTQVGVQERGARQERG